MPLFSFKRNISAAPPTLSQFEGISVGTAVDPPIADRVRLGVGCWLTAQISMPTEHLTAVRADRVGGVPYLYLGYSEVGRTVLEGAGITLRTGPLLAPGPIVVEHAGGTRLSITGASTILDAPSGVPIVMSQASTPVMMVVGTTAELQAGMQLTGVGGSAVVPLVWAHNSDMAIVGSTSYPTRILGDAVSVYVAGSNRLLCMPALSRLDAGSDLASVLALSQNGVDVLTSTLASNTVELRNTAPGSMMIRLSAPGVEVLDSGGQDALRVNPVGHISTYGRRIYATAHQTPGRRYVPTATEYQIISQSGSSAATLGLLVGRVYWIPWEPDRDLQVDQLAVSVTVPSGTATLHLALYDATPGPVPDPAVRLLLLTTVPGAATVYTLMGPSVLRSGRCYWVALLCTGASITVRAIAAASARPLAMNMSTGGVVTCYARDGQTALTDPATIPTTALTGSAVPAVGVRYTLV